MAVQLGRILILSCFVGLVVSECQQNSFKSDAGDKINAAFKSSHRKGLDYSKIEVEWQPFWMVEEPECINKGELFLEMNHDGGDDGWIKVDGNMKSSGSQGKFKWTVDVAPCKDHYFRVWVSGDGGQASFDLPNPVEAVTEEILKESNFEVSAPEGVTAQVLSGNEVKISFTPSECALEYEILYNKAGSDDQISQKITKDDGNSFTLTDQVEACTDYDYYIYAYIGENIASDEATGFFTTAPNQDSASRLVPEITEGTDSLSVSWNTAECPCVAKYEVSICKADQEGCEPVEVSTGNIPTITHNAESLDECTPYTVTIKPIYQEFELDVKTIESRTLSPNVADVIDQLVVASGAKLGEEGGQGVEVFWSPVQCATTYKVYQMQVQDGSDWEEVATSEGTNWKGAGVPCTEYHYGVSVLIGDSKSEIRDIGDGITTPLDDDAVFEAPNLDIIPESDQVVLTFDHGSCISSYEIRICQEDQVGEEFCIIGEYTPTPGEHNITYTSETLEPCTKYNVQINPEHNEVKIVSANRAFVTAAPQPTPPEDSNVTLSDDHQFVELNWSKVRCATGYKILQQIGESDTETAWETDDVNLLSNRIQNPVPCTNYKYGIAAVVGGVVSAPTEWQDITVPPREGVDYKPTMGALSKENETLSFELKPDGDNSKCKVESYEIKYFDGKDTQEVTFSVGDIENNIILLESVPGDAQIYARVKYEGFETPSDWTYNPPKPTPNPSNGDLLVPIVIGVLVAVIVIVVIIFFIVKRRKTSQKYDAEKANGTTDETEKLNDSEKLTTENPKA